MLLMIFLISCGSDVMKFIKNYIEDICIISGLAVIVGTTFFVSKIIGAYALGVALFGLGVYFVKYPIERK